MGTGFRIVSIMKDEEQAVAEWIAYHRSVGATDVWVYDNESTDRTSEILQIFERQGLVRRIPWPHRSSSPQLAAYADALSKLRNDDGWTAFIDADEFIVPLRHTNVGDALDEIERSHGKLSGLGVHWKTFGSSGLTENDGRLVIDRFRRCAPGSTTPNNCIKTLAKLIFVDEVHIHSCKFSEGNYTDDLGRPLELRERGMDDRVTHKFLQINHYMVKSKAEFLLKRARGNGNRSPEDADKFDRFSEEYWKRFDINLSDDDAILRFIPAVEGLLIKVFSVENQRAQNATDQSQG